MRGDYSLRLTSTKGASIKAEKIKFDSVDQYIAAFPEETQKMLEELRRTIEAAVPKVTETITYNMPTFELNGRRLVYFSAWKHHIGLYPVPAGDDDFQKEIEQYRSAKSSLNFPINKPLPVKLIRKFVKYRLAESREMPEIKPGGKKRQAA